jgi:hypothetical protein
LSVFFQQSITKEDILKGDIPRTPFLAIIVPFGKTIHDAETFYVVVEGQVVINGVEIIEALFLFGLMISSGSVYIMVKKCRN